MVITCPDCKSPTTVNETRDSGQHVRRRRICANIACNKRITTVEMVIGTSAGFKLVGDDLVLVRRRDLDEIQRLTLRTLRNAQPIPNEEIEPETEGTTT